MRNVIITLVLAFILMAVGVLGSAVLATHAENKCWADEASRVLKKYGPLKTRAQVLHAAHVRKDQNANPLDVIEGGYNGCSVGNKGKTAVRFYFDRANRLTRIQVWRNYSGVETEMVREKKISPRRRVPGGSAGHA